MKKFFWWIITVAGISILIWFCILSIESRDALQWPRTNGQVVSSLLTINHLPKFINISNDPMRWYGVNVQYEYKVGFRTYLSNRVSIHDGGARSPLSALKTMNKYRQLPKVTVYYNPANPQEAVLEPWNIGDIYIPLLVGGLLVLMGFVFVYEQSFEVKIQGTENHLRRGNIYQQKGKLDQALSEFNKIIEISPYMAQGYKSRGNLYLQQGNWNEAIADYSYSISIDPTDGFIHFNRAKAYLGNKQYHKAWDGMQKAVEMGFTVEPEILEEIKKGLQ